MLFVRQSAADPPDPSRAIPSDYFHQHVTVQRFRECRDGAKGSPSLLDIHGARHHRHGNARDGRIAKLSAPEFVAAEARHHQVEQHETGDLRRPVTDGAQEVQGFETVLGRDGMKPLRGQEHCQHLPDVDIVLHDQYVPDGHLLGSFKSRAASAVENQARSSIMWRCGVQSCQISTR